MSRKSLGPFSGLHLTVIIVALIAAIGIPGSVFAIDTFSNVAVEDPVSGVKATVDSSHRLKVIDTGGSATTTETSPANLVRASASLVNSTSCQVLYTVPAGKALILKSATGYVFKTPGSDVGQIALAADTACNSLLGAFVTADDGKSVTVPFGAGAAIPAGSGISGVTSNAAGSVNLYGYLVPASAVPAGASAAKSDHGVRPALLSGR